MSNATYININGKDYSHNAQLGYVLTDTLSEELNSMTLILNDVERTRFSAFDECTIATANEEKYSMLIVTSMENLFDNEKGTYTYTLNLVSKIKLLERVYLPNLKIRRGINYRKKYVGHYITEVVLPYVKKQFPNIKLSYDALSYLNNFECPDIEWNHPTAKQVINELLSTIKGNPCLANIYDDEIGIVSLSPNGKVLSDFNVKVLDDENHNDMQNYADSIVLDTSNIVQSICYCDEIVTPRSDESVDLTTDNLEIKVNNPIYDLQSVSVKFDVKVINKNNVTITNGEWELDITDFIYEESKYLAQSETMIGGDKYDVLFFKQGDNAIRGLSNQKDLILFIKGNRALENVLLRGLSKEIAHDDVTYKNDSWIIDSKTDYRDMIFHVKYNAISDARIKVDKEYNDNSKKVSIYQSQNQSSIDLKSFMKSQRDIANRLGNDIKILPMICDLDSIPPLGTSLTMYDDYILYKREIAFYNDFAIVNGTFVKNFVQKNLYYGISNRKKFTQIAQASESIVREECTNTYVIFSLDECKSTKLGQLMVEYFVSAKGLGIKAMSFKTDSMMQYATIFPTVLYSDKSVIVTAQMEDNYSIGKNVFKKNSGQYQGYVSYVDSYGEVKAFNVSLYSDFNANNSNNASALKRMPLEQMYDDNSLVFEDLNHLFKKDNAEVLKLTYQFDFLSSSDDLIVGDGIGYNNALTEASPLKLKYKYSQSEKINKLYPTIPSDATEFFPSRMGIDNNKFSFYAPSNLDNAKSWFIVDEDDNILLAVNRDIYGVLKNEFYVTTKGEKE